MSIDDLIAGVRTFQRDVYPQNWELFERLAAGQSPEALMVTCSDSSPVMRTGVPGVGTRINPNETVCMWVL